MNGSIDHIIKNEPVEITQFYLVYDVNLTLG
jgi:hypothetical protein